MNGPGYPLFLAPFIALGLPPIAAKLANGFLVMLAVVFLYKTLLFFVTDKVATIYSYFFGLYWPIFKWMHYRITDFLSVFLICAVLYLVVKQLRGKRGSAWMIGLTTFLIGYLILTKLFFSYIILICLILATVLFIIYRLRSLRTLILVLSLGWSIGSVPYLSYTYKLTNKSFYWGTNGGEQLYWMTSHLKHEYGNWITPDYVLENKVPGLDSSHYDFFVKAHTKPPIERNEIFTQKAKQNLKENPMGYLYNFTASSLRLVFAFPYTHRLHSLSPYPRIFTNLLLLVPLLFSLMPTWRHRSHFPIEIKCIGLFIPIYWGMTSAITGTLRHFYPVIPFIIIWLAFIYTHFVQIKFENQFRQNS